MIIETKYNIGDIVWVLGTVSYDPVETYKPQKTKIEAISIYTDNAKKEKNIKYHMNIQDNRYTHKNYTSRSKREIYNTKEKCTASIKKTNKKATRERIKYLNYVIKDEKNLIKTRKKLIKEFTKELNK